MAGRSLACDAQTRFCAQPARLDRQRRQAGAVDGLVVDVGLLVVVAGHEGEAGGRPPGQPQVGIVGGDEYPLDPEDAELAHGLQFFGVDLSAQPRFPFLEMLMGNVTTQRNHHQGTQNIITATDAYRGFCHQMNCDICHAF